MSPTPHHRMSTMGSAQFYVTSGPAMAGSHLFYLLSGRPQRAKLNTTFIFPENVQMHFMLFQAHM